MLSQLKKVKYISGLILYSLVLILANSTSCAASGYDYTPAIVQVSRANQPDSVGFNLVEQLTNFFYQKIQEDAIYLWDSPAKRVKIEKAALQAMEQQNQILFKENDELFLYEVWKLYGKEFEFQIVGFSFFRRTADGTKVNFGYLDATDVKNLLSTHDISCNANGQANLSYWSALMSKTYNFNLVKFGTKDFTNNVGLAFNLKDQAFNNKKVHTNAYEPLDFKEVEYAILANNDKYSGNSLIIQAIEMYFMNNRHEYFNHATNPAVSYLNPASRLIVTKIEVTERWVKNGNKLKYEPIKLKIYINEKPMDELTFSQLEQFHILVQFKPINEFILDKNYPFTLKRINNETIAGYKSDDVLRALHTEPWNRITNYTYKK